ncbi:MAG: hypothetical protein V1855_00880, partial [bacterium]
MKKVSIIPSVCIWLISCSYCYGGTFFGSQESKIIVRNGGNFYIDSEGMDVENGTIFKERNGLIKGNLIEFTNGSFNNNGSLTFFTKGSLSSYIPAPYPTNPPQDIGDIILVDDVMFPALVPVNPPVQNTVLVQDANDLVVGPGNFC